MTSNPKCSSLHELDSLCKEASQAAEKEFDLLIKKCNINLTSNKEWANSYYALVESNSKLRRQIKNLKIWRWVLIIFLVFPFILMTNSAKKKQAILDEYVKKEEEAKENLDKQLNEFVQLLSYDLMFKRIIEPLWKDINLDIYQDQASFNSWLPIIPKMIPKDTCFLEMVSGKMFDNPFMIYNYKMQTWYMHIYTGTRAITYTTRDSQGHSISQVEMVVATETIPAPQWTLGTELAYHFDKPQKLCFSNDLSKRALKRLTKKNIQTPMENKEFDNLFACSRTDEKDYRVVFTPLAQENYVKLFKEQKYSVIKNEDVTLIQIPSSGLMLDTTDNEAVNYDVETWKNKYSKWIYNFVHTIGLLSLPIASIPLYLQFKTDINETNKGKNIASNAQVQENITHMFNMLNLWSSFDTDVIFQPLDTKIIKIGNTNFSVTKVKCNYFWPEHKVITKPTPSIHRGIVMVPVPVIYYRERHKEYFMCQSIDLNNNNIETRLNDVLVHRGQIMFLLKTSNLPENIIKDVKMLLRMKKKD